ncbi:MAG: hypothetical protein QM711_18610 [Micropruina sp.]|uniref:hypothetical protein n=1 Tax=Micropruina sp. TaxID=2737536 RepID=UPI0039E39CFD
MDVDGRTRATSAGVRQRRRAITTMVVAGAIGLVFTGLAVAASISRGGPWWSPLIPVVLAGPLVWLVLRALGRHSR